MALWWTVLLLLITLLPRGSALAIGASESAPGSYADSLRGPASATERERLEVGYPRLTTYKAVDYDAHVGNAEAVQDHRGILYVANNDGLLEYDGVDWRLIVLPGRSHVHSLDRDADGQVWVGGLNDFGYVASDSLGRATFESLQHHVPPAHRDFEFVRHTHVTDDGVYFAAQTRLFRYRPSPVDPGQGILDGWALDPPTDELFFARGQIYMRRPGKGLVRFDEGRAVELPGGARFAGESVRLLLPYDSTSVLLAGAASGLLHYDGASFTPFRTEADTLLARHGVQSGAVLPGGRLALGTHSGGLVVIDRDGRVLHHIDASLGLPSNHVLGVYPDASGSLWLLLDRGIARVDIDAPFTLFDDRAGLKGVALVVQRHAGDLYVGSSTGLNRLDPQARRLVPVAGAHRSVYALLSAGEDLLAGGDHGVGHVVRNQVVPIRTSRRSNAAVYALGRAEGDSTVVFAGLQGGLAVLHREEGAWVDVGRVPGVDGIIRTLVVTREGTVWLGTENAGAYRVRFPEAGPVTPGRATVDYYGAAEGLPEAGATVYLVGDQPYFTAFGAKVYRFDAARERFAQVHTFDAVATGYPLDWFGLHEDGRGRVWMPVGNRGMSMVVPQPDGSYQPSPGPLGRLGNTLVIKAYPEADGVVWMAGAEGLIRYDTEATVVSPERAVLIRRVQAGVDSLLYGGMGDARRLSLSYADNTLRFVYALPSFVGPASYRTRLEGFDEAWSPWNDETASVYTNLPEGEYVFRVGARTIDGVMSEEGSFTFSVAPPWWRTGWAYVLYAAALFGLLAGIRRYEMNRLGLKHGLELKRVEAVKLRELDQARSRFFANISHEFRTPLTLILGPVTHALERGEDLPSSELPVIQRSGRRLLRLVNQLLDLSKLETGSMRLQRSRTDLVAFLKSVLYAFESLASQKRLTLEFTSQRDELFVYVEQEKMEQVFYNLLSNAIKFTPAGGTVAVTCGVTDDGRAVIEVKDTGIGIPEEHLPHVFDRFYQADSSHTRAHEGTGIGLALARSLVDLHHGDISVSSEEGRGTTFTVHLPLGRPRPSDDEEADVGGLGQPPLLVGREDRPGPEVSETPSEGAGQEVVLVVEDNADLRAYLRRHLGAHYQVVEAADGKAGLAQAQEIIPDLIVTDVMMPGMDGYALSRALRSDERTSHVPIIMLTARAAEQDKLEGLTTGVDDYLLKPFSPRELTVRVRNLIDLRNRLRERFSTAMVIRPSEVRAEGVDRAFLEHVVADVEAHLDDTLYNVDRLAEAAGMSVSQLNRKLNALIDQPAGHLIRSMRLQRGADLLLQGAGTVAEISDRVGFSSASSFSRSFKQYFGCSPSAYTGEGMADA